METLAFSDSAAGLADRVSQPGGERSVISSTPLRATLPRYPRGSRGFPTRTLAQGVVEGWASWNTRDSCAMRSVVSPVAPRLRHPIECFRVHVVKRATRRAMVVATARGTDDRRHGSGFDAEGYAAGPGGRPRRRRTSSETTDAPDEASRPYARRGGQF